MLKKTTASEYSINTSDLALESELSLVDLLLSKNVDIGNSCGGMAACGTCRIIVESTKIDLPSPNTAEESLKIERQFKPNERLSCQISAKNLNCKFSIPN